MRLPAPALLVALAMPALLSGEARTEAIPANLVVLRADLRRADDPARSSLRIDGDLTVGAALPTFDPITGPFRVTLGSLLLADLPGDAAAPRLRLTRWGWRLDLEGAYGGKGRLSLRMDPNSGIFRLDARGFDGAALFAAEPLAVPFTIEAGEEIYATTLDFETGRAGRWTFRHVLDPGPPPPGGGGGGGGSVTTLASGTQSLITTLRFEVVRDQAAWSALWAEHAGGAAGPPPAVDFGTQMVVGIWLGARPTTGYSVNIQRVVAPYTVYTGAECPPCPGCGVPCFGGTPTEGVLADCLEIAPGPGCVTGQAVTYPFHVVVAPRAEGPAVYGVVTVTYCN